MQTWNRIQSKICLYLLRIDVGLYNAVKSNYYRSEVTDPNAVVLCKN